MNKNYLKFNSLIFTFVLITILIITSFYILTNDKKEFSISKLEPEGENIEIIQNSFQKVTFNVTCNDDIDCGNINITLYSEIKDLDLVLEPSNPTRWANDPWEIGPPATLAEQSDFKINDSHYISWYRMASDGKFRIGYETSTDGIVWTDDAGNPLTFPGVNSSALLFPSVVKYEGCYYMFVTTANKEAVYLFNVTDHTAPVMMNNGNPVLNNSNNSRDFYIYNVDAAIDNTGKWHLLFETLNYELNYKNFRFSKIYSFVMGYSYSNLTELDWTSHKSNVTVIHSGGNPNLIYVPDRNALLVVYGNGSINYENYVIGSYASLDDDLTSPASWKKGRIITGKTGDGHDADPFLLFNFSKTNNIMISWGVNQYNISQAYTNLTLNGLYDWISSKDTLNKTIIPTSSSKSFYTNKSLNPYTVYNLNASDSVNVTFWINGNNEVGNSKKIYAEAIIISNGQINKTKELTMTVVDDNKISVTTDK